MLCEELHDRVVSEGRRDVHGGIARLACRVHVAAQVDRCRDGVAHAAFRFDLAEIDRLDSAPARGPARSDPGREHHRIRAVRHRQPRIGAGSREHPHDVRLEELRRQQVRR